MRIGQSVAALALLMTRLSWASAGDLKVELSSGANKRLFETHFAPYGRAPPESIISEPHGLRFRLPGGGRRSEYGGVYSYFALAGDFEVSATFELLSGFLSPNGGACGIAIDTESAGGELALRRGHTSGKGSGYIVSQRKQPGGGGLQEPSYFPSSAKTGVLTIRREGRELICLAADGHAAEPDELCRIPFTDATIRKIRIFAEPGGSSAPVEARMSLKVQAEEITGGTPKREASSGLLWYLGLAAVVSAGAAGLFVYRRRKFADT